MATTKVKVHQFTDGVDGELITWDASGHPTTVATGTAGHVLTSNGTGAAPTFQAATSPITASNGLALASNNITLGGSLTAVTTLTGDATNYITITSTRATSSNASLIVNNTSSNGTALKTLASGTGAGIWGQSTTGTGVYGSSQSISVGGYSNGTIGTLFTIETEATNTVLNSMVLDRNVLAGAGADGIGNKITFRNETSTTASVNTNTIVSKWSAATHASRLSEFSITGYNVAVENTLLTLSGNGAARLNKYGAGTFTGTAVKTLQVDASGNIIEGAASGGSGDINNGGNTTGAAITIGTNDNFALNLETNNTTRISLDSTSINIGKALTNRVILETSAGSTSGGVEFISSNNAVNNVGYKFTGAAITNTSASNEIVQITNSYTAASGFGLVTSLAIKPTVNLTSGSTGSVVGIDITPTLTSLTGTFYGVYVNANSTNAYGFFQSGVDSRNLFHGKTRIGGTSAPTESLSVTGNQISDGNIRVNGQYHSEKFGLTDGGTIALDWNNSNVQSVTIQGNRTFTFTNPKEGGRYIILVTQGTGGNKTLTWPTIKWKGGTAPTLSTAANKVDIITLVYANTSYYGDISKDY